MEGTQRSKRKSDSGAPNAKRVKARVGKRAVQAANSTNTKFRAASVAIRTQAVDKSGGVTSNSLDLHSKRGKSLEELTHQLHHTAVSVRLSATKGLASAVDSSPSENIQACLATLVPAVSKCFIDEDDKVRNSALTVLQDMLQKLSTDETSTVDVLRPFVPLITAYATSAMTSLDRPTRFDGGRAIHILCTNIPTLMRPEVIPLLPAFVGLLSDHSSKQVARCTSLRSLTSLIRIAAAANKKTDNRDKHSENKEFIGIPNLISSLGGKSSNAVFISGLGCKRRYVKPRTDIQSITLSQCDNVGKSDNELQLSSLAGLSCAGVQNQIALIQTSHDLLKKLYDFCVELCERRQTNVVQGFCFQPSDVDELAQLVILIRLFWNNFGCSLLIRSTERKESQNLRQVCSSILALLLKTFPAHGANMTKENQSRYDLANSSLCHLLIDLGSVLESSSKSPLWIDTVLSYVLSNLESGEKLTESDPSPIADGQASSSKRSTSMAQRATPAGGSNDTAIDITSKLLLLQHRQSNFVVDEETRQMLLGNILGAYFSSSAFLPQVAISNGGQKAASLVCNLLARTSFDINVASGTIELMLCKMVQKLPLFLSAWDVDFPFQTSLVLKSLLQLTRSYNAGKAENPKESKGVITGLRNNLNCIFSSGRKRGSKTVLLYSERRSSERSVFERYTEPIQRQVVALVGMLQEPSVDSMDAMLRLCTKRNSTGESCNSDPEILDFFLHVLHTNRRTIPMKHYLGSLISCTGIGKKAGGDKREELRLRLSCRSLCRSGGIKSLPMLMPVFSTWFEKNYRERMSSISLERLVGARTLVSIVASLFLGSSISSEFIIPDKLKNVLTNALYEILFAFSPGESTSNETSTETTRSLASPLVALVECAPELLPLVCEHAARSAITESSTRDQNCNSDTMRNLLLNVELLHEMFSSSSRETTASLENAFKLIKTKVEE